MSSEQPQNEIVEIVKNDNNRAQKKALDKLKRLQVWVKPEKYERFKEAVSANGSSVYAEINAFIDRYLEEHGK